MNETSDSPKGLNTLPEAELDQFLLPTPFAVAGIGLLLGAMLPGGITGGEGFLLGLAFGILLSVIMPILAARDEASLDRCPTCGARVIGGKEILGSTKANDSTKPGGTQHG